MELFAEWASEAFRGSPLAEPDEITDTQARCMGEHLADALVGVESVEDVDEDELDERLETAQRGLDYDTNSGMYSCFHEELVDLYAGFASDGFADFYFYSGFSVPTVTSSEAECIGEYMVDTYQSSVEYLEYVDADEMSFVANLAMLSCLDMNRYLAAELTQAWGISDGEAECVIEAMFEEYPVDTVAAGELDRNDVVALAIAAGCISEDQLVEEP